MLFIPNELLILARHSVIFDFQCGLPIEIKQKLKEDERFRFPNSQSYSLIWRDVGHGLRSGILARICGSPKHWQGYCRKSLTVKDKRSGAPGAIRTPGLWFRRPAPVEYTFDSSSSVLHAGSAFCMVFGEFRTVIGPNFSSAFGKELAFRNESPPRRFPFSLHSIFVRGASPYGATTQP